MPIAVCTFTTCSWTFQGRAIRAFNSNVIVSNYPVMEVTAAESELLQKVTRMRKVEIAANAVSSCEPERWLIRFLIWLSKIFATEEVLCSSRVVAYRSLVNNNTGNRGSYVQLFWNTHAENSECNACMIHACGECNVCMIRCLQWMQRLHDTLFGMNALFI